LCIAVSAQAATRNYVLAVGNNAPPSGSTLEPLRYADDDAADFYSLVRGGARAGFLLTVLDDDSQRRFPALVAEARAPSLVELERSVASLRTAMDADVRAGDDPVLLFFFSGHGTRGNAEHPPALAMSDGGLTQEVLYQRVLAALPARYIHLFVDACHAESVVRPRDADAEIVPVSDQDVRQYAAHSTLERFPNVGAVVATSETMQAHEWDLYQRGVFTHELVSGLRGGADVNGDGVIEYSELAAFLGAANHGVEDARARVDVIIRPPRLNHRAVLLDLRGARVAHLVGRPAALGPIWVEDRHGNRLADVNAEPAHDVYLDVPADEPLYVHAGGREALVRIAAGKAARFELLSMAAPHTTARGAVGDALERGLFASAFGPHYYRGWVDHQDRGDTMQPVALEGSGVEVVLIEGGAPAIRVADDAHPDARLRQAGIALTVTGGAIAAGALVLAGFAAQAKSDFDNTRLERPAGDAAHRYSGFVAGSLTALGVAVVAGAIGTWALVKAKRSSHVRVSWSF
jgi:hypothetical protein